MLENGVTVPVIGAVLLNGDVPLYGLLSVQIFLRCQGKEVERQKWNNCLTFFSLKMIPFARRSQKTGAVYHQNLGSPSRKFASLIYFNSGSMITLPSFIFSALFYKLSLQFLLLLKSIMSKCWVLNIRHLVRIHSCTPSAIDLRFKPSAPCELLVWYLVVQIFLAPS